MNTEAEPKKLRWAYLPECEALAAGWSAKKFTDSCNVIAGQSPPSETYNEKGEGLPFLQGNGDFSDKYPMPKSWCTAPVKIAETSDTLISVRAPVGEVNRADRQYAIGRGLAAIRATSANADFIYYGLQRWRWSLQRVAQGTTFDAVTARHFSQLLVALPDGTDEQAAIARVLDAVDAAIDRAREAATQAAEVKRALAQGLFSKGTRGEPQKKTSVGFIPKSWDVKPVNAVVTNFEYGLSLPMHLKGATPILRMGNIQQGDVVMDELKYVTLSETLLERYSLKRGDVLFNRTNSQEWVGKIGIYRTDAPAVFASYLIRLHPDTEQVDNYYLGQLLNSYDAQCRIKRFATPGVQQVNINAKNLGKVMIPVPVGNTGLEEQREIAALLEAADAHSRSYAQVIVALQQLKKSLMHDLLTGSVRVDPALFQQEAAP